MNKKYKYILLSLIIITQIILSIKNIYPIYNITSLIVLNYYFLKNITKDIYSKHKLTNNNPKLTNNNQKLTNNKQKLTTNNLTKQEQIPYQHINNFSNVKQLPKSNIKIKKKIKK